MSLDYIFVKASGPTASIVELEVDESFTLQEYKGLGIRLFSTIIWDENSYACLDIEGARVEVKAHDSSLSARLLGLEAEPTVIFKLASQCQDEDVVIIDGQTSELVTVETAAQAAEDYVAWQRTVLDKYK